MKQGNFENEEFIRVGTTLYKLVNQPRLNGGYVKKRIVWNNETLRQDYGKDYLATVPKYDGFCTVPDHVVSIVKVENLTKVYGKCSVKPNDLATITQSFKRVWGLSSKKSSSSVSTC